MASHQVSLVFIASEVGVNQTWNLCPRGSNYCVHLRDQRPLECPRPATSSAVRPPGGAVLPLWLQESGPGAVGGAAGIWFSRQAKSTASNNWGIFPGCWPPAVRRKRGKKKGGEMNLLSSLGSGRRMGTQPTPDLSFPRVLGLPFKKPLADVL